MLKSYGQNNLLKRRNIKFLLFLYNKLEILLIQKPNIPHQPRKFGTPTGANILLAHINNYKKHKRDACVSVRENRYKKIKNRLYSKTQYSSPTPKIWYALLPIF